MGATQKDARPHAADDRMRISRPVGRLLRRIAEAKRWTHKTAAEAAVEHFAEHLGIRAGGKRQAEASTQDHPPESAGTA